MNKNICINGVLIALLIVLGFLTVILINALDHHRFAVEELAAQIKDMKKDSGTFPSVVQQTNSPVTRQTASAPAANAQYFDPHAVPGGRLISALSADVGNMNLLISNDAYVSAIWSHVNDSLAERNYKDKGDGQYEPMLAESWKISPDKKRIRVKLRKGIFWHDFTDPVTGKKWENKEVTAGDFKFFVDVLKNPDVDCAPLRVYYNDLERIDIFDDYEFDVVWSKPYFQMEDMTLSLMPLPRHLYHAYPGPFNGKKFNDDHVRNRMLIGCGPYQFVRWDKGKRILLRRFDRYFGKRLGILPPLEYIAYDIIQHPNTRLQSLLSKDLDADSLTPDQWVNRTSSKEFGPEGYLKKFKYPGKAYSYIGLNQKYPVFREKKVRQALSHLVNLEKIRHDIFSDLSDPVSGPFPKASSAYDPSVKPYAFDIVKARQLLEEAGWKDTGHDGIREKNGKKLTFTVIYPNTSVSYQKMLPVLKEDMKKAGVQMNILGIEWSVLVQRLEKKQFEACLLGWTGSLKQDPYQLWHSSQAKVPASSNHIGFMNPRADRLIEAIRTTFDADKRNELYHQFHQLIHEEAPYIFLFSQDCLEVLNSRYQNVQLFHDGIAKRPLWVPVKAQMRLP